MLKYFFEAAETSKSLLFKGLKIMDEGSRLAVTLLGQYQF